MFNPMLATVLLGGCEGHDYVQHIVIYWAASTAGAIAAFFVYPVIKTVLYPPKDGKKLE